MKKSLVFLFSCLCFAISAQTTWQMVTPSVVPEGHLIYVMSAPSKDVVWASTVNWVDLTNPIPTQKVIRTVNGGTAWTISSFSADTTEFPNSLYALDDQTAYITAINGDFVSYVYRTRNGGTTWEKLNVEHSTGYFNTLHFWDKMNGIVLGDPDYDSDGEGHYLIYTTRDGGDTWVASKNTPAVIGGFDEYGGSSDYGVLGANTVFFTSNSPFNRIFKSEDRGLNWREIMNPLKGDTTSNGTFCSITFSDDHNGMIAYQYNPNYPGSHGGEQPLMRTNDGGETWTKILGTNASTRTEKGVIGAVSGADSVYAIGHFNQGSSYTTDFGKTYTFNTFGGNCLKFFSPTEGWMSQFTLGGTHGRIGKFTGNLSPSTIRNVTFQVDMTGQTVSSNGVFVTGDYWNWKSNALKMNYLGGNVYEAKVALPRGTTLRYKFMNGGAWGQNEQVPEGCGTKNTEGGIDRTLTVGLWDMHVPKAAFSSCLETKGTPKPVDGFRWCSPKTLACEYFEGYGMNTKIGLQSPHWKSLNAFKTGGTEGGSDDADIVSLWNGYTNYSGGRALHIQNGNDIMWLLGNQTTSNWDVTMRLYVPANYEAHIAALSNETSANSRLFDYVLQTNKTAWSDTSYKNYAQNEWVLVKLNINLDAHSWSVTVNGMLVYSASNAALTQLGALEFFSPSAYSDYFIDELEVKRSDITQTGMVAKTVLGVYPNPAQEDVSIHYNLDKKTDVTLSLTDMNGRTIWSKTMENTRQIAEKVNLSNWLSGVYFIKIAPVGEEVQVQRLVIAK